MTIWHASRDKHGHTEINYTRTQLLNHRILGHSYVTVDKNMLTDDTELNTAGTTTNYFNLSPAPNEAKEDTDETDNKMMNSTANEAAS